MPRLEQIEMALAEPEELGPNCVPQKNQRPVVSRAVNAQDCLRPIVAELLKAKDFP